MQIYSTNARFYSKNTLFCPLKCVFYKQNGRKKRRVTRRFAFPPVACHGQFPARSIPLSLVLSFA